MVQLIGNSYSSRFLFNDVYCVTFAHASLLCFLIANKQISLPRSEENNKSVLRYQLLGVFLMSLAASTKMNSFLYFPAIYLISSLNQGILTGTFYMLLIAALSLLYGLPFLLTYPKSYLSVAYNFGRGFDLIASRNYNFLSDEIFTSATLARTLLALHLILLVYALFSKWLFYKEMLKSLGIYPLRLGIFGKNQTQKLDFSALTPTFITEVFFVCNFIGVFCMKSLHSQFSYWYVLSAPFIITKNLKTVSYYQLAIY
jgi:alpha-1,3-mannosyltransferase